MTRSSAAAGATAAKALVVLVGFAWGFNWIATRILLGSLPPLTIRTLSIALGAMVVFAAATLKGDRLRLSRGEGKKLVVASFFNVTLFNACSVYAQVFGTTSRAVVIAYSMPIWTFLLGRFILKEKTSTAQLIGLALCATGLGILIFPATRDGLPLGALLALGSAWSWAAGTVYQQTAKIAVPILCSTAWQLLLGDVLLAAGMFALDPAPILTRLPASAVAWLAYSGLVGMGLAYLAWFAVLRTLQTTTAAIGTLLVPVVGVVASVVINGERPGPGDVVGFLVIFAAVATVLLAPAQARDRERSGGP
jgi:drug/metabolite transporter (DMT)-like permease